METLYYSPRFFFIYLFIYLFPLQVSGYLGRDTLHLGKSLTIPNQVFAQITSFHRFVSCQGEEGILGLGLDIHTDDDTASSSSSPPPLPSLLDNLKSILQHPIFSMYLNKTDDYAEDPGPAERVRLVVQLGFVAASIVALVSHPLTHFILSSWYFLLRCFLLFHLFIFVLSFQDPSNGPGHEYDDVDPSLYRPISANSEILFGAVDHKHYHGCLKWHDLAIYEGDESTKVQFWSFNLNGARVADQDLPYGDIAIVDSGSTFVIGPTEAIGTFANINQILCFVFDELESIDPVPCDSEFGFEVAAVECDDPDTPFEPLQFVADGVVYEVGADELLTRVTTEEGDICIVRILSDPFLSVWILGDVFLDRYYAVFDFDAKRIGLAENAAGQGSICPDDWELDVEYNGKPATSTAPASNMVTMAPVTERNHSQNAPVSKTIPKSKSRSSRHNMPLAMGLAAGMVMAGILMVVLLTRLRRRRYQRADWYDDADGIYQSDRRQRRGGQVNDLELELPGLL
jgi:hypothetical protein